MINLKVIGYSNSGFTSDVEDRKNAIGQIFFLSDLPIIWNSLKQKVMAYQPQNPTLYSCKAEYIAITSAVCQAIWIARLEKEVIRVQIEAMKIWVHDQSAIMLSKMASHQNITMHIDTRYHFI